MNVSDTCNAAADLIEVRGWTAGGTGWVGNSLFDDGGSEVCVEGALMAALGSTFDEGYQEFTRCPVYVAVTEHLNLNDVELWSWNDDLAWRRYGNPHPDYSDESRAWAADRVIATLRAVAVIHAARENEDAETRTVEGVSAS